MTTTTNSYTWIGKDIKRREDPDLLTGRAEYTNDVKLPGMLYAAVYAAPMLMLASQYRYQRCQKAAGRPRCLDR